MGRTGAPLFTRRTQFDSSPCRCAGVHPRVRRGVAQIRPGRKTVRADCGNLPMPTPEHCMLFRLVAAKLCQVSLNFQMSVQVFVLTRDGAL